MGSFVADFRAGFLVFLIALPLCLGIAMASGYPPIAGILTAVVGGVVVSLLGSAPLTIKGPAAGLIVIVIGAVQELGQGDPMTGYRRALAASVIAAIFQIIFAFAGAATIGLAISPSVVHGMLAAIGVIIISKQSHVAMGVAPAGKGPFPLLAEIPHSIMNANPEVLFIGAFSLLLLFAWPMIRNRWTKKIPAHIIVLVVAMALGVMFDLDHEHVYKFLDHDHQIGPKYLVQLPGALLQAVAFPDFSAVFSATSIKYIVMLALVGTIESTLTVIAVDTMDPKKKTSNLNRDLFALGVGNLVASLIGGLPMISEIVRSKANVDNGATSSRANFFHGALLLAFVALAPNLLHAIPLAALAAMLIFTGTRLASPNEFKHAFHLGWDQLALFLTTLIVTLATDLLVGVAAGIALKVILHIARGAPLNSLFRTRIQRTEVGNELQLKLYGTATFINLLTIRNHLRKLPPSLQRVTIDVSDAYLIDHTFLARMENIMQELPHATYTIVGLDRSTPMSAHPHAARRRTT